MKWGRAIVAWVLLTPDSIVTGGVRQGDNSDSEIRPSSPPPESSEWEERPPSDVDQNDRIA